MGLGRRVQSGKVVAPGSSPSSCDQGKSLSHSQFPLLCNELLGPLWLPRAEFCDRVLTGDASALYGGKANVHGEKAEGTSAIMLGPGAATPGKYSQTKPRCWLSHSAGTRPSLRSLCLLQEPSHLDHHSGACHRTGDGGMVAGDLQDSLFIQPWMPCLQTPPGE